MTLAIGPPFIAPPFIDMAFPARQRPSQPESRRTRANGSHNFRLGRADAGAQALAHNRFGEAAAYRYLDPHPIIQLHDGSIPLPLAEYISAPGGTQAPS